TTGVPESSHPARSSGIESFDLSLDLDQKRLAVTVERLACGHADPAFADAVFLDVVPLLAVEADAHVVFEDGRHVVRAARVDRQAVGKRRLFGRGRCGRIHGADYCCCWCACSIAAIFWWMTFRPC